MLKLNIGSEEKTETGFKNFVEFYVELSTSFFSSGYFWYFWLTIQNTANRQVRNLFCLLAVCILFPLARCAPPPHPTPLLGGRGSTKKAKKIIHWRWRGRRVFVTLHQRGLSLRESDPRPKVPGPGFSDFIFAYCAISFWTFLIWSASFRGGRACSPWALVLADTP
jgi:hypothetical protein